MINFKKRWVNRQSAVICISQNKYDGEGEDTISNKPNNSNNVSISDKSRGSAISVNPRNKEQGRLTLAITPDMPLRPMPSIER